MKSRQKVTSEIPVHMVLCLCGALLQRHPRSRTLQNFSIKSNASKMLCYQQITNATGVKDGWRKANRLYMARCPWVCCCVSLWRRLWCVVLFFFVLCSVPPLYCPVTCLLPLECWFVPGDAACFPVSVGRSGCLVLSSCGVLRRWCLCPAAGPAAVLSGVLLLVTVASCSPCCVFCCCTALWCCVVGPSCAFFFDACVSLSSYLQNHHKKPAASLYL